MTCRSCLGTGFTPLYEPCGACGGMGVDGARLWRWLGLIYLGAVLVCIAALLIRGW